MNHRGRGLAEEFDGGLFVAREIEFVDVCFILDETYGVGRFANGADDFVVALGHLYETGTPPAVEEHGRFMHELGHDLGLRHGGGDETEDITVHRVPLAEAEAAKSAASGLAEATVQEAKAVSLEKEGTAEATVLQKKAVAEAKGIEAKADAVEKQGLAEANVSREKYHSEATGITEKAEAMKQLDSVGKEHEEFKLQLDKEKSVEIAAIDAQRGIVEFCDT